ncbi:MAG: FoF1 ATP synthase subunit a [Bacillota bacterium]
MHDVSLFRLAVIAVLVLLGVVALVRRSRSKPASDGEEPDPRKVERRRTRLSLTGYVLLFIGLRMILALFTEGGALLAPRAMLFGLDLSTGVVIAWILLAALAAAALLVRFVSFPKFKDQPKGVQSAVEAMVESVSRFPLFRRRKQKPDKDSPEYQLKMAKRKRRRLIMAGFLALVIVFGVIFSLIAPPEAEEIRFEISAPRTTLFGFDISTTVITTWIAMAILTVAALLIRFVAIPKFKDEPKGFQNVLELLIETTSKYASNTGGHLGENLSAYIFSVGALLVTSAALEFFSLRAPTADLMLTAALAICTFILINYYGIRRKGAWGRIASFAQPKAIVFPFKLLSELAIPISLACRLFGNMVGGMIVMELLYMALGSFVVGIPALFGLYFNVFHPLIQAFIFITLSLTFMRDAVE